MCGGVLLCGVIIILSLAGSNISKQFSLLLPLCCYVFSADQSVRLNFTATSLQYPLAGRESNFLCLLFCLPASLLLCLLYTSCYQSVRLNFTATCNIPLLVVRVTLYNFLCRCTSVFLCLPASLLLCLLYTSCNQSVRLNLQPLAISPCSVPLSPCW